MDIQQTRESVLNRQIDVPQINVEEVEQIYENDENEEEDDESDEGFEKALLGMSSASKTYLVRTTH